MKTFFLPRRLSSLVPVCRLCCVVLVASAALSCANGIHVTGDSKTLSAEDRKSLELAFSLLDDTLGGEAELKWLLLVKKLTLQGPGKEVEDIMVRIQKASEKKKNELKSLRRLTPAVTGDPSPSPMGDAIQAAAQEAGTEELIFSSGVFNIRFLFLQAQATRMISVVAAQAAWVDPNPKRQRWLTDLAQEFEDFRDDLVKIAAACKFD